MSEGLTRNELSQEELVKWVYRWLKSLDEHARETAYEELQMLGFGHDFLDSLSLDNWVTGERSN